MKFLILTLSFLLSSSMVYGVADTNDKFQVIDANVSSAIDVIKLFPTSVDEIKIRTKKSLERVIKCLDDIIAVPDDKRIYMNSFGALDNLAVLSNAAIIGEIAYTLDYVHPDKEIRDALKEIQNFFIDNISSNRQLYNGLKYYAENNAQDELLTEEQKYFIKETLQDFKRSGIDLPDEQLEVLKKIKKELVQLGLDFDKNIAQDKSNIEVAKEELEGLAADYIQSLPKSDNDKYIVYANMPNFNQIFENCIVAATREKFWQMYNNRAYPVNQKILQDLIEKRYEVAHILGFDSYAALELSAEMVQSPERVAVFINDLTIKAQKKAIQEMEKFTHPLPEGVRLVNGKLQPWDVNFVKTVYKKVQYNIDENKISEYFPVQSTIDNLLDIYQKFFNLQFMQIPVTDLWDTEVKLIEVFDKTNKETVGYLFLDLYPRPNKYSSACEVTIIPTGYQEDGLPNLGVAIVIANFPKPMLDNPSLLLLKDVTIFFHEFGHAMHALLGRTSVASFSGTKVKRDFVEMPSQMLEEWLWQPEILKMVSKHYKTGQSLPDDLIAQILNARTLDSGFFITRQLLLAHLSLEFLNNGPKIEPSTILMHARTKIMPFINSDSRDHFYASFWHFNGYGARYYGYIWSKVFAHDLFNEIKKNGLLDPAIGRKYVDAVIGKGGSQDPNDLLKNFLGREPNQEAFLKDMGLQ